MRGVRRRLRWTRPRPAILMYHRVAALARDPWDLAVAPALFDEQMRFLRTERTLLPLETMVAALQEGTLPPEAVAVTFDDGYRDNLIHALPSLKRYAVPATLFVCPDLLGSRRPLWWDELAQLVLDAPEKARVQVLCRDGAFDLSWGLPEPGDRPEARWRGWEQARTARQECFQRVWRAVKKFSATEQQEVLAALRAELRRVGCPAEEPGAEERLAEPMSRGELEQMCAGGLVTLAPHTMTHASLPSLTPLETREEIAASARGCEELTGRPARGFAYPYGDHNEVVVEAVRQSGVGWACTTQNKLLRKGESLDVYRLPRMSAPTASLEALKEALRA